MVTTFGAADKRKPGVDEVLGMVLSGGYLGVTWVGNLDSAGPVERGPVGNSEETIVGN